MYYKSKLDPNFQNLFLYPSPNIVFTILQHAGKFTDSAIVCDFIFLCYDFSIDTACFWGLSEILLFLVHSLAWCVSTVIGKR
jgi:hypothetical protein